MSGKLIASCLGLLLAVGLAGVGIGYGWGVAHEARASADRVTKAESKVTNANGDRDAAVNALTEVRLRLDKQKTDLATARLFAQAALDARDTTQVQLSKVISQRDAVLRKAAHESPDCADLATLPVCPAVAERLWGLTPNPSSGGGG